MLVTLSGIVIANNPLQLWKAELPISFSPDGKVTAVMSVRSENTLPPMHVTG